MIWGHRAPELAAKLRRINRMAMNTFANFPKSTPTTALEIMLDIAPLHLHCLREGLSAKVRLKDITEIHWSGANSNKTHAVSHLRYLEQKITEFNVQTENLDACNLMSTQKRYSVNMDSFDGAAKHRRRSEYNIYTDGSRILGTTGAGFTILCGKEEISHGTFKLPDDATVFQAEVFAIMRACEALLTQDSLTIRFAKIFIDSQAAILALNSEQIRSRLVHDTIGKLNELALKCRALTLVWIPAHKGHEGNERADMLAKWGARTFGPCEFTFTPTQSVKKHIKNSVYQLWRQEWQDQHSANHARTFYGGPDPVKARYVFKLSRSELGRLVRIVTGHNNLNFFQNKIGLWHDPFCRFCARGPETITHLLHDCPRFSLTARNVFSRGLPSSTASWSVREFLLFSYTADIDLAMEGSWKNGNPPRGEDINNGSRKNHHDNPSDSSYTNTTDGGSGPSQQGTTS